MKAITIQDFLNYQFLSQTKTIEDSNRFSFVKTQAKLEENRYESTVYISDQTKHEKIYTLKQGETHFIYKNFLYINSKDRLKKINTRSRELVQENELNRDFKLIEALQEDLFISISNYNPEKEKHDEKLFEVIETIPFQSNGQGFTQAKISRLSIYDFKKNQHHYITDEKMDVQNIYYDPIEKAIYFTANPKQDQLDFFPKLYVYSLTKQTTQELYSKKELAISQIFKIKNQVHVMASDLKDYGINQNRSFYKLEGKDLVLSHKFELSSNNSIGSDVRYGSSKMRHVHNDLFYFIGSNHHHSVIYVYDGNKTEEVYRSKDSIDAWFFDHEDQIIAVLLKANRLQELYRINLKSKEETLLSAFNQKALQDKLLSKPEHFEFMADQSKRDAWILYPHNYQEDKTYPAILNIHGGPKTIYNDVFYHEMQVWASQGYFVFFTNPKGSDAFDNEFADIRGEYGQEDFRDLMKLTDHVLEHYPIDSKRLGVTGGSYGGFMTNWIVSHTNRFKAAATQRSISNWISFYGTSDIGYYFAADQTQATPYKNIEAMWEQSPLKHAQNIRTPLLFIHADQDYRCPIEQAMQLYTVLKKKGVDSRLVWFKNENHDLSRTGRPKSRIKRLAEITNWMNHYLK